MVIPVTNPEENSLPPPPPPPPPRNASGVINSNFLLKFIKKMIYDNEFSKFLLHIL